MVVPLSIPTQGWNVRDQLSDMAPVYALRLNNLYAEDGSLILRKGYDGFVSGVTGGVETLMEYVSGATAKLFACGGGNVYDITTGGAAVSPSVTGATGDRWDWINFATLGGTYLVAVNGADGWYTFDGTTLTDQTITGATASSLIGIAAHKSRLWAIEKNTLSAWYMDNVLAISGGMTEFPVGGFCERGGALAAISTWTRDGGSGPDDFWVAITTEGEVLVYAGSTPASAGFSLVGRYTIPRPLGGTRSVARVGGALMVLTEAGLISMDDVVVGTQGRVSGVIEPYIRERAQAAPSSSRWQVTWVRETNRVIINVPTTGGVSEQAVFSVNTGAWALLQDQDATTWIEATTGLYFGTESGNVLKADTGETDDGEPIAFDAVLSPLRFGSTEVHFKRARVQSRVTGATTMSIAMVPDYMLPNTASVSSTVTEDDDGALWDEATWDEASWSGFERAVSAIVGLRGKGVTGALRIFGESTNGSLKIDSITVTADGARVL